jgi:iron complex outermembrane receptor protein
MLNRTVALIVGGAAVAMATPAIAQSSQGVSEGASAGDIIVTARRVEERLQDVPISITVFSAADVAKRNIVEPQDLVLYTPSLAAPGVFGRDNTAYAIRGFTQANRTTASVAVYFADVVAPRSGPTTPAGDGAGPGQFFDLQNVQVLKGPQGTLFGRNTTGGAVLLVPQKPTSRFEGYVEGLYGNYDWKGVQAAINVPLGETARLRVSGEFQDRNGLTKNVRGGPDFDNRHYVALRASLVVDLTPELENYTILQYLHSNNHGSSVRTISCNPLHPIGQLFCGSPDRTFEIQNAYGGAHIGDGSVADPFNKVTRYGIINTTTWLASDHLKIKNIASYNVVKGTQAVSIFGSPVTFPSQLKFQVPVGTQGRGPDGFLVIPTGPLAGLPFAFVDVYSPNGLRTNDQYTWSEELQFQGGSADERLSWQGGLYFERSGPLGKTGSLSSNLVSCSDIRTLQCIDAYGLFVRQAVGSVGQRRGTVDYRNIGIYGQADYKLTDALKLTLGARYTWDRTTGVSDARFFNFPFGRPPVERCISIRASLANDCRLEYLQKSEAPTWLIGLDYKPTPDMLLYAKYSRGYRQGAISLDAAEGYNTFKPEKVDAYEVGLKASIRGSVSGVFNIAGFYNKLDNQQVSAQFQSDIVSPADGIVNGGKSRIYGIEADTTLRFFDSLTVTAAYAYLNTKLISLVLPTATFPYKSADTTSITGSDLVFSPHHKLTASLTYDLPFPKSVGDVQVGVIYTYTSSQIASAAQNPIAFGVLPSFQLVNFNLDWKNAGGTPVDISLFMTNAFDEKYFTYVLGPALQRSVGIDTARYGDPRSFGIKVRYRFGS